MGHLGAPPLPMPSRSMSLQHLPPPWSRYPAVCQWPGCPHPGPGSAESCPAPTPGQGSLGLSDSSPARWSPGRPLQSLGLHPDLGERDRKLSPDSQSEGPGGGPACLLCRSPDSHAVIDSGDTDIQGRRYPACTELHPHTLHRKHFSPHSSPPP